MPQNLIHAIVETNTTRKDFIVEVIIANRKTAALDDVDDKVYTCDLFGSD